MTLNKSSQKKLVNTVHVPTEVWIVLHSFLLERRKSEWEGEGEQMSDRNIQKGRKEEKRQKGKKEKKKKEKKGREHLPLVCQQAPGFTLSIFNAVICYTGLKITERLFSFLLFLLSSSFGSSVFHFLSKQPCKFLKVYPLPLYCLFKPKGGG